MHEHHGPSASSDTAPSSRREFLRTSAGLSAAALASGLATSGIASAAFVQGSDPIRVGVIGSGGRGTGAAFDSLKADSATRIVALGDLFPDAVKESAKTLKEREPERGTVPEDRQFSGFDAYKKVLETDCDLVILATPPYFRPYHLAAAVEAGKHVFFEKPVAVDPAGIKLVLEAGRKGKEKNLAMVTGTQRRHQTGYVEVMKAIEDGKIGEVLGAGASWMQGGLWHRGREPEWSETEYQIRNWLYFDWLSGDQICEQHIHNIDVALWAFGDKAPQHAYASGGRTVRTQDIYGNVWDHMDTEILMGNGRRIHSRCRQWPGASGYVGEEIVGSKGRAELSAGREGCRLYDLNGSLIAEYAHTGPSPYVQEHIDMIRSIREGKPLNETDRIANTNLVAIIGRESAYSGKPVSYDWGSKSDMRLGPDGGAELSFGPMDMSPVPVPGVYKLPEA